MRTFLKFAIYSDPTSCLLQPSGYHLAMPLESHLPGYATSGVQFTTTQWSVVLSTRELDSNCGQHALEKLCCTYWPAVYSYLRRKGRPPEEAKDLAQEFFARVLRRHAFASADPQRGRFRSFLLECLHCFLIDHTRAATRQKRGSGLELLPLDQVREESFIEPFAAGVPPDELYDRRWRLILLQKALQRLETEFMTAGKQRHFAVLKEFLTAPATAGAYEPLAVELQTSSRTVAVTIHRMRHRFRELIREELAQTVSSPAEFDEELKALFG